MKSEHRVLVGIACLLGISLAYQNYRQRDTAASENISTVSRSKADGPVAASGRWLVGLEPKTESHIDGLYVRLKNPSDRPVTLALWSRDEPEVDPGLAKRRRADGVTGPFQLSLERRVSGQTAWECLRCKWNLVTKQEGDHPTDAPPLASLPPGDTRTFLVVLGVSAFDSMYRWRVCLYEGAGGRVEQKELAE